MIPMYQTLILILLLPLIAVGCIGYYAYRISTGKADKKDLEPYSQLLVALAALVFVIVIVGVFYFCVADDFAIRSNMGQVGDFIGGLTNPLLSFVGLIVLLRTNLIQTNEARKTSLIMLEQQNLMAEERFESTFYILLDRYETAASAHLRLKKPADKMTYGLRMLQDLRKDRVAFDALPSKAQIKAIKAHVKATVVGDKVLSPLSRARKVFDFIDGSSLSRKKKNYYFSIFKDAMEPGELIIFLTLFILSPKHRRRLRSYRPASSINEGFFICQNAYMYFKVDTRKKIGAKT
jgi:uncharacterized membrane protein